MSDFDKEAEREKLRKKYEREEEKRKATEQMSELLLKGATMTNAHCGDCGDPIFRYDGQEFCPTCQKPVDREGDDDAAADQADADQSETPDEAASADANGQSEPDPSHAGIEVTTPSDDATVQFGGDDGGERDAADDAGDPARDAAESPSAPDPANTPRETTGTPAPENEGIAAPADGTATDHLDQAQVVLAQTVERFARRAAAADDPRDAREYLETAREAARTLDATRF